MDEAPLRTPLHAWHESHGGRLVEFGGWSMPVQYTSIVEEHRAVRERVGLFDISHMGRLDFDGPDILAWLNRTTTNDVRRLEPGQIQYSLMVDEDGGILDDILVSRISDGEHSDGSDRARYVVVCNASNRNTVLDHLDRHRDGLGAKVHDMTSRTAMIAVQGPLALEVLNRAFAGQPVVDQDRGTLDGSLAALKYYHCTTVGAWVAASRTGYTGEDGFELVVLAENIEALWEKLLDAGRDLGIAPCGLGARDTLRFEAAMPLYGHELSRQVNPYAAGLGWAVKLGKGEFVGREALKALKVHPGKARIGLALEGKRIARQGCAVMTQDGDTVGEVTSGTFAPTLEKSLAMALVDQTASSEGSTLIVDVRGRDEPARVVPLPFYRRAGGGKPATAPGGPS